MNLNIETFITGAKIVGAKELEAEILRAFLDWVEEDIDDKYMAEQFLDKGRWPYPPPGTKRKNGEVAGNPRNIYDLGNLYKSGRASFDVSIGVKGAEASWHWTAKNSSGEEYAWFVHEGEGPHARAPRPWTDELVSPYLFEGSEAKRDLESRLTNQLAQ